MDGIVAPVKEAHRREDRFHAEIAIPALKHKLKYDEQFSDHDEKLKALLDSLGNMNGSPCFIEVKLYVTLTEVGAIERKLNNSFRRYGDESDKSDFAKALRKVCPSGVTPIFGVIANRYSGEAVDALAEILRRQSERLQFAWVIWQCTKDGLLTELGSDRNRLGTPRNSVALPDHMVQAKTARKPSYARTWHSKRAADAGAGSLFETSLAILEKAGARMKSRQAFLAGHLHGALVRLYSVGSSAKEGVLLAVDSECENVIKSAGLSIVSRLYFDLPDFRVQNITELATFLNELEKLKRPDQHQTTS